MTKRWRAFAVLAALAIAATVTLGGPVSAANTSGAGGTVSTNAAPEARADYILISWCGLAEWVPVWGGPRINPRSDGQCNIWEAPSATAANYFVHNLCLDAICAVQRHGGKYFIFEIGWCDVFDLQGFGGLFDTHNHGSMGVWFYDKQSPANVIGRYAGGRDDPVNWNPIGALRTCAF